MTNSTLLTLDYLAFNRGGCQRLDASRASLKAIAFSVLILGTELACSYSSVSGLGPQLKYLLLPFVECLQGLLVEVCLSIVIAQFGGWRLDLGVP